MAGAGRGWRPLGAGNGSTPFLRFHSGFQQLTMSGYTTTEVSDLLGLKPAQVRHFVRRSLLAPRRGERGEYRFDFQDVVLLRTAKSLLEAQVSSRRAVRALLRVRAGLGRNRGLAGVRIFAAGASVLVREDNRLWEAETGQTQFDFDDRVPARQVARIAERSLRVAPAADDGLIVAREADSLDSDEWYNLGLDLEDANSPRAAEAYAKALELNPENADAHVNLGRLRQLKGDLKRAKRHYERALDLMPTHQLALYNLGTVFDELSELERAAEYYLQAPAVPDAHYNLARIFEILGDELAARRHLRSYRQLLDLD
jgi:tetratricopeptide (TPR) repeat protein